MAGYRSGGGSPLGPVTVLTDEAGRLVRVRLPGSEAPLGGLPAPPGLHDEVHAQLSAYFTGELRRFDLPLRLEGTPFQTAVWEALRTIPWGETRTYGEVAALLGRPRSARAVGAACGRNPLPLLVPCHRVIGSHGGLHGFTGGLDLKRALLRIEGIRIG